MEDETFDAWTRRRFAAGAGLAAALLGLTRFEGGAAKKKGKGKKKLCRPNGTRCGKPGKSCKKAFCLNGPFTIEANQNGASSPHDAYLFVPPENASTGPAPYLNFACNPGNSNGETAYPFADIDQELPDAGDGVTTIYKLLPGRYEYWIQLKDNTAAGALTIVLRDNGGRVVRQWQNPANSSGNQQAWHVFDIDGKQGTVASIDDQVDANLPSGVHNPYTFVCAF